MKKIVSRKDSERIRGLVQRYKYKAVVFLNDELVLKFNPDTRMLYLGNIYHYSEDLTEGVCTELAFAACKLIRSEFPHLQVYRAGGSEPEVFMTGGHTYLLVADKDYLGVQHATRPSQWRSLVEANPLVVDPSFQIARFFGKSGYGIEEVMNHDHVLRNLNGRILSEGENIPLLIDKGRMTILKVQERDGYLFQMGIFDPEEGGALFYSLTDNELYERANTEEKGLIDRVRQLEVEYTTDPFPTPEIITVV